MGNEISAFCRNCTDQESQDKQNENLTREHFNTLQPMETVKTTDDNALLTFAKSVHKAPVTDENFKDAQTQPSVDPPAQNKDPEYTPIDSEHNAKNRHGFSFKQSHFVSKSPTTPDTIVLDDGALYTGTIINGIRTGKGKLVFPKDKGSYEGSFKDNLYDGVGRLVIEGEMSYEGNFEAGKKSGYGVQVSEDGSYRYSGEWVNGMKHGSGIILL